MAGKTTQQAFSDLKSSLLDLRSDILDAIPKSLIKFGKLSRKYMVLAVVFYSLAVYLIYIGEYPSAIIASLIGLLSIK